MPTEEPAVGERMRAYLPQVIAKRDKHLALTPEEDFGALSEALAAEAEHIILCAQYIVNPSTEALDAADHAMARYMLAGLHAALAGWACVSCSPAGG